VHGLSGRLVGGRVQLAVTVFVVTASDLVHEVRVLVYFLVMVVVVLGVIVFTRVDLGTVCVAVGLRDEVMTTVDVEVTIGVVYEIH
jgi:hypothetical protein